MIMIYASNNLWTAVKDIKNNAATLSREYIEICRSPNETYTLSISIITQW